MPPDVTAPDASNSWLFELVLDYGEHDAEAPVPAETGAWPARIDRVLRLASGADDRPRWHGNRFNLRSAVLDGGDLHGVHVPAGTVLDLSAATFPSGTVDFRGATFSDGTVDFRGATFSDGTVDVIGATFFGGTVTFRSARFSGGTVNVSEPADWSVPPIDIDGSRPGVLWPSQEHLAKITKTQAGSTGS